MVNSGMVVGKGGAGREPIREELEALRGRILSGETAQLPEPGDILESKR